MEPLLDVLGSPKVHEDLGRITLILVLSLLPLFALSCLSSVACKTMNFTANRERKDSTNSISSNSDKTNNDGRKKTEIQHVDGLPDGYITWQEYFMSVAQLASKRSKDPVTKVGACIVSKQNKIVATGYNGMPNGVKDSKVPWIKEGPYLDTKYAYVVHAELNAILNSVLTDQTSCSLYVSLFPCNECAKAIIQTGIRHVIYLSDKHKDKDSTKAAKKMFSMAGVKCEQFFGRLLIN